MNVTIRRLEPADADALYRLRLQALVEEPFAFLASPGDDAASSADEVRERLGTRRNDSAVIGAFEANTLVGMVGVARDRFIKAAHRVCVWGVYVLPGSRRRGIGRRMLEAALDHARTMHGVERAYLSVSDRTPDARRLYEGAGFVVWGEEPDCIRHEGESAREFHLSIAL